MGNPLQTEMMDEIQNDVFKKEDWIESEDGSEVERNPLSFERILLTLKGTQGKVLTIIDATFIDEKRLKYVKDLIRDAFSKQADWLFELFTGTFEQPK